MKSKNLIVGLAGMLLSILALPVYPDDISVIGAGASFPNPLYQKWAAQYNQLTSENGFLRWNRRTFDSERAE
jgi:ABC-type phosphate transport system substrate-binding protein